MPATTATVRLGLRENLALTPRPDQRLRRRYSGLERTIVPLIGTEEFGIGSEVVGDVAHPAWRATSVGIYRFWRDLGYAVGTLMAGCRCLVNLVWAVHVAWILTALSGLLAWAQVNESCPASERG